MGDLKTLLSGLVRGRSRREETVLEPDEITAPTAGAGAVIGKTAKTTVDQTQVVDAKVNASVLHDVLVTAGVGLDSNDMSVVVGTPRLVSSNLVTSPDGKFIDREQEIEVKVVIKTKERLSLFVDALAGVTVDGATLTLTPREAKAPTVATTIEGEIVSGAEGNP
jgi:hypothetical protein